MTSRPWITTEVEINAPCAIVWKVLTDFPAYGSWNPFIRRIAGDPIVGERLRVFARLPCGLPVAVWPRVLEYEAERKLKWLGNLIVPGLLDGEHLFMAEALAGNKTRFVQMEEYSGVLLPLFWNWLKRQGEGAFEAMNRALKLRAERSSAKPFGLQHHF